MQPVPEQLLSHITSPRIPHAATVSSNVIGTNDDPPSTPAMQSLLEGEVRRRQSPDEVQHWAAIAVPSGLVVAVGSVMQMP